MPTEHQWFERKVTLRGQAYLLRHCTKCHCDLAKLIRDDTDWMPVRVGVFNLSPLERSFEEECIPAS
jgi:hypothetical protein